MARLFHPSRKCHPFLKEMAFAGFWYNLLFSTLVLWTGIIGILITHMCKGSWSIAPGWTWVPIFWLPLFTSWPVALSVLFGGFDS